LDHTVFLTVQRLPNHLQPSCPMCHGDHLLEGCFLTHSIAMNSSGETVLPGPPDLSLGIPPHLMPIRVPLLAIDGKALPPSTPEPKWYNQKEVLDAAGISVDLTSDSSTSPPHSSSSSSSSSQPPFGSGDASSTWNDLLSSPL